MVLKTFHHLALLTSVAFSLTCTSAKLTTPRLLHLPSHSHPVPLPILSVYKLNFNTELETLIPLENFSDCSSQVQWSLAILRPLMYLCSQYSTLAFISYDAFICTSPPPARLGGLPPSSLHSQHRELWLVWRTQISSDIIVIHLVSKYLLNTYCMPGTVLSA